MAASVNIEDFDAVFGKDTTYPRDAKSQIHHGRTQLNNKLFFDRLLESIGVNSMQWTQVPNGFYLTDAQAQNSTHPRTIETSDSYIT
jgi:hypothetical protein